MDRVYIENTVLHVHMKVAAEVMPWVEPREVRLFHLHLTDDIIDIRSLCLEYLSEIIAIVRFRVVYRTESILLHDIII